MKRHTKPWGCTFKECFRRFGRKADWKRHEISQHFHMEMWKCCLDTLSRQPCYQFFHERDTFRRHLRDGHSVADRGTVRKHLYACRIGRNCQGQTWCGFCRKILPLKQDGRSAWDERFEHIDRHFSDGKQIQHYMPVDSEKPKGRRPEADSDSASKSSCQSSSESFHDESFMFDHAEAEEDGPSQPELQGTKRRTHEGASKVPKHSRKRPSSQSPLASAPETKKSRHGVRFCVSIVPQSLGKFANWPLHTVSM